MEKVKDLLILLLVFISGRGFNAIMANEKSMAFRSTLPLEQIHGFNGLILTNFTPFSDPLSNSITVCMRFNFAKIIDNIVLDLAQMPYSNILWFKVERQVSFLYHSDLGALLLKDPKTGRFDLWQSNKWHSICISLDSNSTEINFIKVMTKLPKNTGLVHFNFF